MDLFSIVPVKRSHSVCAQGGINAAKNQNNVDVYKVKTRHKVAEFDV